MSLFREISLQKNISISLSHNADDMQLVFDKEQLEKVFFNLLNNAFKFTPAGGKISLTAALQSGKIITKVMDNGRGIAPEFMDNIFESYFQVPDYEVQNTGYGIGLALAKNIVEQHGGNISVESTTDEHDGENGTIFTVTLPQNNIDTPTIINYSKTILSQTTANSIVALSVESPEKSTVTDKIATILIVEDNAELRNVIVEHFACQYCVLESSNGSRGLDIALESIPDIVISDVMMPEMDGFEFCAALKKDKRTSHVPVILLTAKSAQRDHVTGLETGADIYLTKPFSTRILELHVQNLLAARERLWEKFSKQVTAPVKAAELHYYRNNIDKEFLMNLTEIVDKHFEEEDFGVEKLSRKIAMSAPILYKKLKAVTGLTVNEFIKNHRMQKAGEMLLQTNMNVNEVAFTVGYNDTKYFSREFKKKFGKTPSEYSKGG